MGSWGDAPWDNDNAADWFITFMKQTNIRKYIMETIQQKFEEKDYPDFPAGGTYDQLDMIRAAIGVFIMLGRAYIWPVEFDEDDNEADSYESDLTIVLNRAKEIKAISEQEDRFPPLLDKEIAILENRLERLKKRVGQETDWPWDMNG